LLEMPPISQQVDPLDLALHLPNLPPSQPWRNPNANTRATNSPARPAHRIAARPTTPATAHQTRRAIPVQSRQPHPANHRSARPLRFTTPRPRATNRPTTATGTTNQTLPRPACPSWSLARGPGHGCVPCMPLQLRVAPPVLALLGSRTLCQRGRLVVARLAARLGVAGGTGGSEEPAWTHRALATRQCPGRGTKEPPALEGGGVVGAGASGSIISIWCAALKANYAPFPCLAWRPADPGVDDSSPGRSPGRCLPRKKEAGV
jgi:hypothetical protein